MSLSAPRCSELINHIELQALEGILRRRRVAEIQRAVFVNAPLLLYPLIWRLGGLRMMAMVFGARLIAANAARGKAGRAPRQISPVVPIPSDPKLPRAPSARVVALTLLLGIVLLSTLAKTGQYHPRKSTERGISQANKMREPQDNSHRQCTRALSGPCSVTSGSLSGAVAGELHVTPSEPHPQRAALQIPHRRRPPPAYLG